MCASPQNNMTNSHRSLHQLAIAVSFILLLMIVSCTMPKGNSKGNEPPSSTPLEAISPASTPNEPSGNQNAASGEPSLVALSAGALVVTKPQEFDETWSVIKLLDENPRSGWATPKGVTTPQTIVIALPERTVLKNLEFDTGNTDGNGRGAKDIVVEVSDASESNGFRRIADVSLQDRADNQKFPVSSEVPGRWVRLTTRNNHGSAEYIELFDFRAAGRQLTQTEFPDVTGTYTTNYGDFHLKQEGTSITGCYEHKGGLIEGGVEGRVIKFMWSQADSKSQGPAIMVFTPDTSRMYGLWWDQGNDSARGVWNGTKKSTDVGSCAHWAGGVEAQITKELNEVGRVRVYGINFDSDSDYIKDESKPTLDKIGAMLKTKAAWKITIEGHTDSTSTAQHNQELSERRAAAVRNYLQSAGIDASRLKTVGYGATKPVASNDNELGRAQNRRVELVK
jgi:outer membrane protein OmpA-like peptidoglycan-associated protein